MVSLPVPQLKFLYVAITRARNNLRILDSSEAAEPMKVPKILQSRNFSLPFAQVYWSRKGQIKIESSAAEIQIFAVENDSPEEWSKTGRK